MAAKSPDCLACGLTPQQVIQGIGEVAQLGAGALGQPELALLIPIVETLALDIANLVDPPTAPPVPPPYQPIGDQIKNDTEALEKELQTPVK